MTIHFKTMCGSLWFIMKTIAFAALIALLPLTMFAQGLSFTEIMYDLPGSDEKREWCELYNFGTEAVTVVPGTTATSWRFHDGSAHTLKLVQGDATIAPGGMAILTSDSTTWLDEHPGFSGTVFDTVMSLSNSTGTIGLSVASAEPQFTSVTYDAAWGGAGTGFSLERDTLDEGSMWRESKVLGGTPGAWGQFIQTNTTTPTSTPDDISTTTPTSTEVLVEDAEIDPLPTPSQHTSIIESTSPAEVRITELLPNPTGSDTDTEWIELYNPGDAPIELIDWTLQDTSTTIYTFSLESAVFVIGPRSYLTVKRNQSKIALNNAGGDSVYLKRADGSLADAVTYFDAAREDHAWARFESGWEWTVSGTPGGENLRAVPVEDDDETTAALVTSHASAVSWSPPDQKSVMVTEIFPNQKGADDDEWIEIGNVSSSTIDLGGWKLDDGEGGSKVYAIPQGTMLEPGGYLVFRKSETKLLLGNAKDSVRLITPIGSVWHSVAYTAAPEDESFAYDPMDDDWLWTASPTPGSVFVEQESVAVLGVSMTEESIAETEASSALYGIVIVPPKTLYKQRMYVQALDDGIVPKGTVIELYSYKGSFPDILFGEKVAVYGSVNTDRDIPQVKIDVAEDIQAAALPGDIQYVAIGITDIAVADQFTPVVVESSVLRRSEKSLRVGEGEDSVLVRFMDTMSTFDEALVKDSHVRISGIVKSQSGSNVLYIPNSTAIVLMPTASAEASSTDVLSLPQENVIEGALPESPVAQWYIVLLAPGVAIAGFVLKKYILPRLG